MNARSDASLPFIHNKLGPYKIPRGFLWVVSFQLPAPASQSGWIVQEVYKAIERNASGKPDSRYFHYWEAWPVATGARRSRVRLTVKAQLLAMGFSAAEVGTLSHLPLVNSTADDCLADLGATPNSKGTISLLASARFYPLSLPKDFVPNHPKAQAGALRATDKRPVFWKGPGSYRFVNYTWNFTGGRTTATLSTKRRENWPVFGGAGASGR